MVDHTRALGSGEGEQQGATPLGSGHTSSTETLTGLGPAGGSPSRMQWQPIATAPRDGTDVLLWAAAWDMTHGVQVGCFLGEEWLLGEGSVAENEPGFDPDAPVGDDFDPEDDRNLGPTHWMSLPPAPGMEAEGRNPSGVRGEARQPVDEVEAPTNTSSDPSPTREQLQAEIDALTAKVDSLAPHGSCACSYDRPGDVCLHHSPALAAAQAEVKRLKARLQEEEAKTDRFARHMRESGDLVAEIGGELAMAGCRIAALTVERDQARTALSDSESKRAVLDREIHSFIGCVQALQRHTNPHNVNDGHSQQWFAVHDAIQTRIKPLLTSTPSPQETARVED